ncbi:MAG TPA: serine/threonine-protein kinase, partial [Gemmataceae bacterium]|nr:serine/threonine-protein kinase [Gemmataceae bacterium]
VAEWGVQAAEALEHAHQLGVVHRDVKPANLMIDGQGQLWVTDFGLARTAAEAGLTLTGDLVGTLRYMSPEQALARHGLVDHRTDVYSLGVTLYELLTLRPAFAGKDRQELLRQIAFEEPTAPRKLTPAIPAELETIVLRALAKEPRERYATAQDLADDLRRFLDDQPIRARRPTVLQRLRKFARRHRAVVRTAAIALIALLVLGVTGLLLHSDAVRAEQEEKQKLLEGKLEEAARRAQAETQRADEQTKRVEALEREKKALEKWRQTAYYLKIALAHNEHRTNRVGRAEQVLADCPEDLRHWEWHYLRRLCHPELAAIPPGNANRSYGAFSSDGRRVARLEWAQAHLNEVVTRYDAIRVYDVETGKEVLKLPKEMLERSPSYHNWAFSADLKLFAAHGGNDPVIHVWDAATGKERAVLTGLKGPPPGPRSGLGGDLPYFSRPAFSPGGDRLAAIDERGNLFVWEIATAKQRLHVPDLKSGGLHGRVAFSPDDRLLATTSQSEGIVKLWHAETGKLVLPLAGLGDSSMVVVFSPKGSLVAAGGGWDLPGRDHSVRVWDTKTGQTRHVFGQTRAVTCLAFSPDEKQLAIGSAERTVALWDLRTKRPIATYRGHDAGSIQALAFSADGKVLRSLGFEGSVKTWDATRAPEARALEGSGYVQHVALSPDGGLVAMPGGGFVRVCDADTGKELWKFVLDRNEGQAPFSKVSFSPDGRSLAAGSSGSFLGAGGSGRVWVWEAKTGKLVRTLPDRKQGADLATRAVAFQGMLKNVWLNLEFAEDLPTLVETSKWMLSEFSRIIRLKAELPTLAIAFSPDGKRLASGGNDGTVHLWDVATGKELRKLARHLMPVTSLGFSRDGRLLLSASQSRPTSMFGWAVPGEPKVVPGLKVWDLETGKEVLTLGLKELRSAAISPDGAVVAAACNDRTARLYNVATGKETLVLKGHLSGVMGIAFSPDGKRIVTRGESDGAIMLWDAKTG